MSRDFLKMHGLGNDFVVIDARTAPYAPTAQQVRAIADRKTGVGCDQFIVIEPPVQPGSQGFMRIRNADGGEVGACGNAARCVGWLLMTEAGTRRTLFEMPSGLVEATLGDGTVTVDMGPARLAWNEIPLASAMDTLHLPVDVAGLPAPVAVSMGNPHCVFIVDDAEAVDVAALGPGLEHHPLFPERTNVEFISVLSPTAIRMRVWERGVGITQACGTGSCAAWVAAVRRGLVGCRGDVVLDGGTLTIEWRDDGRVLMTGPVAVSFTGTLSDTLA